MEHACEVRFHIFKFYLEHCHPPSVGELATITGKSAEDVLNSLEILEQEHHLVLHKKNIATPTPIAMVHPFAHLPTPYIVSQGVKSWWANCIWCSLGLASMLNSADGVIHIHARSGSIGQEIHFEIENGTVSTKTQTKDPVIHFSVPPSEWWRDVHFTCSTIQVFASEKEPDQWCKQRGFNRGSIISLPTMWELAKVWYYDKADYQYRRKTPTEVKELYTTLGLVEAFWGK
ncbi:Alkylmercury lyase-domain-containing protein [Xylogone sp. PMI_703]|nr:Alkylmercury lyase-domain-containing protein [Xylogone sp. PMI_703]